MTFLCRVRVPFDARNEAINTDIFCSALGGAERPRPPPPSPEPLSLAGPPHPRGPGVPKAPSAWTSTPTPPFPGSTWGASTSLLWQRPQVPPRAKTLFRLSRGRGRDVPGLSALFLSFLGRAGEARGGPRTHSCCPQLFPPRPQQLFLTPERPQQLGRPPWAGPAKGVWR